MASIWQIFGNPDWEWKAPIEQCQVRKRSREKNASCVWASRGLAREEGVINIWVSVKMVEIPTSTIYVIQYKVDNTELLTDNDLREINQVTAGQCILSFTNGVTDYLSLSPPPMTFPPLILPVLLAAMRPTFLPALAPLQTVEALPMCWWLPPPWGCSTGFMATPRT